MENTVPQLEESVRISSGHVELIGDLCIPQEARGIVLFAHGSGSGRHSARNRAVARTLQRAGLATLLLDLLTESEETQDARTGHMRFDIHLLSERLVDAADWLARDARTSELVLGCFGASTGAAAALVMAASRPERVAALVSRGGRPDLAGEALEHVVAPVLFIIGGNDADVLALNEQAFVRIESAERELRIIPGATHLFEEPGALEAVAELATEWFTRHFREGKDLAQIESVESH